jgi:Tfp pilus assembly protein PilN
MLYRVNLILPVEGESHSSLVLPTGRSYGLRDMLTDPVTVGALAMVLSFAATLILVEHRTSEKHRTLLAEVAVAIRDSTQLDEDIFMADDLRRRQSQIAARLAVYHEIDHGRYVWAHLMDEFAIAASGDLWLDSWEEAARVGDSYNVRFRIEGFASDHEILSDFMRALEASAFIADISLNGTRQHRVAEQNVLRFTVEGRSRDPDPTLLDLETIGTGNAAAPVQRESPQPEPLLGELPRVGATTGLPEPPSPTGRPR